MRDATKILQAAADGDVQAAGQLLALVYAELRHLAQAKMAREQPGHTLQPTALVHEAWLRMFGKETPRFNNRAHFFGAASEAMRRILVDSARRKMRMKNGGELVRVELDGMEVALPLPNDDLLALDEALNGLAQVDARATDVVKLCYFVGLTREEAAAELDISLSTAERLWSFARAWLFREMERTRGSP
jgi:RNA polymerase sigma factor (TIGR02999 family)